MHRFQRLPGALLIAEIVMGQPENPVAEDDGSRIAVRHGDGTVVLCGGQGSTILAPGSPNRPHAP